jgi:serine protease Do
MKTIRLLRKALTNSLVVSLLVVFAPLGSVVPAAHASTITLPDFADLAEKTGPAVVNIRTTERVRPGQSGVPGIEEDEMQEFFRRFFGIPLPPGQSRPDRPPRGGTPSPQEQEVPRGVGSGFIISPDGFLLTNAHVVDGADEVYVTLTDKREFKAKIVGLDKRTDVAVVKIEGTNLPRLTIGDPNRLRVGEWVIAIGSPFGLDNTVTAGIISAKARDTGDYLPLIQTDVAVNPGNSGGPLINMLGEVVGINSQIYSRSGGFMGISFAVPIDEAMRVADQLKTTGRVTRGRIGVQIGEVTKDVAESLGLARAQGALVQRVEPGGPAERGGLEAGDIILRFNGANIERSSDLPRMVGATKPGTRATVSVWRRGAARDIVLTVTELKPDEVTKRDERKPKSEQAPNALGLVASDLTEAQRKELRVEGGVMVDAAEGPAARAGVRPGDVILRLNNSDVTDARQFNALVTKLDPRRVAVVLVRRGEASQFIPIRPVAQ